MQNQIKDKNRLFLKLFISPTYTQKRELPLIVSPGFLHVIIDEAQSTFIDYQKEIINEILNMFVRLPINSLLLYCFDCSEIESVLDRMVLWMIKVVSNEDEVKQCLAKLHFMVSYYRTSFKNLQKLTQWVSKNFYEENLNPMKLMMMVGVLKIYLGERRILNNNPQSFFYMFGGENSSGIKTVTYTAIKNTMYLSLCFNHMMTFSFNNHNLFQLTTADGDRFSGCIHKNQLIISFKSDNSDEGVVLKVNQEIMPNTWYQLAVEYTTSSTIVRVNNSEYKMKPLLVRNRQRNIKQAVFGDKFHGMMMGIVVASKIPPIQQQYCSQNALLPFQNWQCLALIKSHTSFTQSIFITCFPFCLFELGNQKYCFDVFQRNHSLIGQNTVVLKYEATQHHNYKYGGIKMIIPLFYIAKFYNENKCPTLIEDLLGILVGMMKSNERGKIEEQVSRDNILLLLGHHLSSCYHFITVKCLKYVQQIHNYFQSEINRKSSFKNLIWGMNSNKFKSKEVVDEYYTFIHQKYIENISFYQKVYGVMNITYSIISNIENNRNDCCIQHYLNHASIGGNFTIDNAIKIKLTNQFHYAWFETIVGYILQRHFKQSINLAIAEIQSLLRIFLHQHSVCLYLTILKIINQINFLKSNIKNLKQLTSKCDMLSYMSFLSEKSINHDLITQIIYLVIANYFGSEVIQKQQSPYIKLLKDIFNRLRNYPKTKYVLTCQMEQYQNMIQRYHQNHSKAYKSLEKKNFNQNIHYVRKQEKRLKQITVIHTKQRIISQSFKLYNILRNFITGKLSYEHQDVQYDNHTFDQHQVEILFYYFRISGKNIRELILKDLLQCLIINSNNLKFYRKSYWINYLLIKALGNLNKDTITDLSFKIISFIFELSSKNSQDIRIYYLTLKSIILPRKQVAVQLFYRIFNQLLNRNLLSFSNICSLFIIIHFEILQSKIQFTKLSKLRMTIMQNISDMIFIHFKKVFNHQIYEQQLIPQSSIELMLSMHSQKSKLGNTFFDKEVKINENNQITFLFDTALAKVLADGTIDENSMVKKIYFIQVYVLTIGELVRSKKQSIKNKNNTQVQQQLKFIKIWLDRLTKILIYFSCAKMCQFSNTINQYVRMVAYQGSLILLYANSKDNFVRLWGFFIKIMIHFSRDISIIDYQLLQSKMIQIQINPIFVQVFAYFLKNKSLDLFLSVQEMKLLKSDQKIIDAILKQEFIESLTLKGRINNIIKLCEEKNNQLIKQHFLEQISLTQTKFKNNLMQYQLFNKPITDHLFHEQKLIQEQQRLKFLYEKQVQLRKFYNIWRKLWNNLRIYHKPYSFWIAQKDSKQQIQYQKQKKRNYKFIMSQYSSNSYLQPILQAKIIQPWHVVKVETKQNYKFVTSFMDTMKPQQKRKQNNQLALLKNIWKSVWLFSDKKQQKQIKYYQVTWIKQSIKAKGKIFLRTDQLIFCYEGIQQQDTHLSFQQFSLPHYKLTYQIWRLPIITKITKKRYLLKYNAIQFRINTGKCILLSFNNNDSNQFIQQLNNFRDDVNKIYINKIKHNKVQFYLDNWFQDIGLNQSITEAWLNHKISNLQYLIQVNQAGCRSTCDLSQYLVAPWIIEMNNQKQITLRDLSKTMGGLGSQSRRKLLIEKFQSKDPFNPVPPFFYGTHYSSPGVIFNYMIRISPFTQFCKHLQGGKFDIADRLFLSMISSWKSSYSQVCDVRELIPQFYYIPQTLINIQNHNLGVTQCGQIVNNVELPMWAQNNPYKFVVEMRRQLESVKVSEAISKWIDLIFGYKQKGKQAEDSLNIYFYLTYQNYGSYQLYQDQVYRKSNEAQIVHFGQIPPMIFNKPHQSKIINKIIPLQIGIVKKINLMNSFKQKVIQLQIIGSQMRILKRNIIDTISINRQPAVLIKSLKFQFEKSQNQIFYNLKKQLAKAVFFSHYILIYGYFNNQFRVYNRNTGNLQDSPHPVQSPVKYVHVNQEQNLILVGCQSGILHIYEIEYDDKKEIFPYPINHISESSSFFAITFGNFVGIYKIVRSLHYMSKRYNSDIFIKFFRSFKNNLCIRSAYIVTSPLWGVILCDNSNIKIYSINGQFLNSYAVNVKEIGILKDQFLHELLYYIENNKLVLLSTPEFNLINEVQLKEYEQIINNYIIYKNEVNVIGLVGYS